MGTKDSPMNSKESGREAGELIACHECDFLHTIAPVPGGGKALCTRCGALLYRKVSNSFERALALNLSAFMLFLMANFFPFISLKASGRIEEDLFLSGAVELYRLGMGELGLLVVLTSFVFPLLIIGGMLYILFPLRFGRRPWKMAPVYRIVRALMPWSLIAVFMLGVLISIVKLLDLASVIPGTSLFAFAGLMVLSAAAHANMDPSLIWAPMKLEQEGVGTGVTAAERGLISCHTCTLLAFKAALMNSRRATEGATLSTSHNL